MRFVDVCNSNNKVLTFPEHIFFAIITKLEYYSKMRENLNDMPLGPDAMKAVALGVEEATAMRHSMLGRYHLFIGLVRATHGMPKEPFNAFPDMIQNLREEARSTYTSIGGGRRVTRPMQLLNVIMQQARELTRQQGLSVVGADQLLRATLAQDTADEMITLEFPLQKSGVLQSIGMSAAEISVN